jgi:putative ABC transport system ATP-binding protein
MEKLLTDDAFINVREVDKSYRRGSEIIQVFKGLNLGIEEADFVAIMGPSGSGKTTLLNLVGGLDRADSGSISVGGQPLTHLSTGKLANWRAAHVGLVFQSYNLLDGLSAARNVELPLLVTRIRRKERSQRVRAMLEAVGLTDRYKHKPNELSGGQRQRVAIARALISDPDVLLCDEPTGDLDRHTADQVLGLLRELNEQRGKTILMVTHDPLAAAHAKHIIHVDKGTVVDARLQEFAETRLDTPSLVGG